MNLHFTSLLAIGFAVTSNSVVFAHENHPPHVHGLATLTFALDGKTGTLQLEAPGDTVVGFEHEAKTAAEKKAQKDVVLMMTNQVASMVKLDPSKVCTFTEPKFQFTAEDEDDSDSSDDDDTETAQKTDSNAKKNSTETAAKPNRKHKIKVKHSSHSDFHAQFRLNCDKELTGSYAEIAFDSEFPRLQNLKVQILSDQKQEERTLAHGKGRIRF